MNNAAVLIENCDVDILVVRLKQPLDSSNQTNLSATKCLTTNFSTIRSCNINPVKPEITLLDAIMKSLEVVQNSLDPCASRGNCWYPYQKVQYKTVVIIVCVDICTYRYCISQASGYG